MKLRRAVIEGLRGAPVPLEIRLGDKSLCVLAENGHGKTTVVDALELWASGDLAHYHRAGYELDCVVNVDAAVGTVTCEPSGLPALTRTLADGQVSDLQPAGPIAVGTALPPPLPVLRHRTMAEFMNMSPGGKRQVLLELFGLAPLIAFRRELKTMCNTVRRRAEGSDRTLEGERNAFDVLRGERDVVALAEELRVAARLDTPVRSEAEILGLEFEQTERPSEPNRPGLVTELARQLGEGIVDMSEAWNTAVADRDVLAAGDLGALLKAAERILPGWQQRTCPLCRQERDPDALLEEVRRRALELRDVMDRFARLQEELATHRSRLASLKSAIDHVVAGSPTEGWPEADKLVSARDLLERQLEALDTAQQQRSAYAPLPPLDLPDLRVLAETAASSSTVDGEAEALIKLVRLQDQLRRLRVAEREAEARRAVATAAETFLSIADARIRQAIEGVLEGIGHVAASFYGRLVSTPIYSDVKLEYTPGRAGGVEFKLVYDRRHEVSPPQRVMSESQLNALGLALFLARLKVADQPWRTVVLDDVVNSFDANHRLGLARLLADEFTEWQVLLFTHDRVFASLARKLLPTWQYSDIVAWSPTGGPVLADGKARERLRAHLAEGRSASELGGLGRVALEQGLSLPLEKLGLEIRYDPLGRYGAYEYLQALRRGLRDRKSSLADLPVLARMEADNYLVNLGAHDRPADPALSAEDLKRLVEDLTELEEGFVCSACGDAAWAASLEGGRHHQCRCSALAV